MKLKALDLGERKAERIGNSKLSRAMAQSAEVKFMSTTVTERKSQTERAIERTEKLLRELKQASDIMDTKDAIMKYVSDIDCCSGYEDNPFVLGDTDFAHLFVQSLERRGKTPLEHWVPMIIDCAQAEHSPEVQRLLEKVRKSREKTSEN